MDNGSYLIKINVSGYWMLDAECCASGSLPSGSIYKELTR